MLMGHYASTLDFSNDALQAAEKGLAKLEKAIETLGDLKPRRPATTASMPRPLPTSAMRR